MQFNDTTNEQGIVQDIRRHTSTDETSYPIKDITRAVNSYYKRAVSVIQEVDARWNWDDNNATVLPIIKTNVVSGQDNYELPTNTREVLRVEIKTEDGVGTLMHRIERSQIQGSIEELFEQNALPRYYEHIGNSLVLYPSADYNITDGLTIHIKSTPELFVYTDTTKEPGFDSLYHEYLVFGGCYDYFAFRTKKIQQVRAMEGKLARTERDMRRYYSQRGGTSRVNYKHNPRI